MFNQVSIGNNTSYLINFLKEFCYELFKGMYIMCNFAEVKAIGFIALNSEIQIIISSFFVDLKLLDILHS